MGKTDSYLAGENIQIRAAVSDVEERNVQKIRYQSLTTTLIVALQHSPLFVSDQNQGFADTGVCVPPLRSGTQQEVEHNSTKKEIQNNSKISTFSSPFFR